MKLQMLLGLVALLLLIPTNTQAQEMEGRLAGNVIATYVARIPETAIIKSARPRSKWSANCVLHLRNNGYYVPQNPLIAAKTLPVATQTIPDGTERIAVTYESPLGHVAVWRRSGDTICTVVDSAGIGRCMSISSPLLKGFL